MNLNASPSPFPIDQMSYDHDHLHHHFTPNFQVASSSSSNLSCRIFFGPTQDQTGYHLKDDDYAYQGGSSYDQIKNNVNNGLKLTLWKNEDNELVENVTEIKNKIPVNWMSSKMRLMHKMKNNPDSVTLKIKRSTTNKCHKDQKVHPSSSLETDLSSNSFSYINNSPIRVCADCNTTKTPLWRSGPKGPKSLCNACGIRQRKARRAMAAAASGTVAASNQPPTPTSLKIKVVQHKEKISTKNVHFKKRFKMAANEAAGSSSNEKKKIDLEDFLINLSNTLAFHRVFPEEEKDAAILLMALSSGLVHG